MGAGIAFGNRADLSRLFDPRPPGARIDWVRQDVFVEVNEEGTEAAAVTSIGVVPTSAPPPPLPFVVDRPFVFAIRDDASGELLFVGRVVDPVTS
jgi:serine protease inhibitor